MSTGSLLLDELRANTEELKKLNAKLDSIEKNTRKQ